MATPKLPPHEITGRKWIKAYVDHRLAPDDVRAQRRLARHGVSLFHWFQDGLEFDGCVCEAHLWWDNELLIHRRSRARD